jgi:hypothetical protein
MGLPQVRGIVVTSVRSRTVVGVIWITLAVCVTAVMAQDFGFRRRAVPALAGEKAPYDGRFTFARLRHGYEGGRGEPPWAHDYPRAERNFARILSELTLVDANRTASNIVKQDDPDLFISPFLYVSEPGFWTMNEDEVAALQQYVKKGGFIVFDDFRGDHWFNFQEQVQRIIPNARLVELDTTQPIFHSFFDIKTAETQGYYGQASFQGVFEDNDPQKRLLLVASYNHDLGELWEYSDTGFVPVDLSNDAYKYGVNYVVYALTH